MVEAAIKLDRGPPIDGIRVTTYVVPTDEPESDGTLEWDRTTMVLVELSAGGTTGLGYTYADRATATVVRDSLADIINGEDAFAIAAAGNRMVDRVRNLGRRGIAAMAISAVDVALWDLKARLLELPLAVLLGMARVATPVYGSGGFTSYPVERLREQLAGWAGEGMCFVKMKVDRNAVEDPRGVQAAREAIVPSTQLFVDANGAY